jgi:hypothetical protein
MSQFFQKICESVGLPKPEPEVRFHPVRKWRIDYLFTDGPARVALEVEGGVWKGGRHNRASGFLKDMEKYNALSACGIVLLRATPQDLNKTEILELIRETIEVEKSKYECHENA